MKIALVAPLFESVPPKFYGGTERVVYWMTEGLTKQGHEVTLFASGDSQTPAKLHAPVAKALRLDETFSDKVAPHVLMLEKVAQFANKFDIIHFHLEYLHLPLSRTLSCPSLTTMHGRLDMPYLMPIFDEFREAPVVSISNAQRRPLSWLNWQGTVYHGLPENSYKMIEKPRDYALFLGRICPEKRVDRAIEIAKKAGIRLIIAAKVDPVDREYYRDVIKPLITEPEIEYIGEVGDQVKNELIGNAYTLLHPIEFPEPFGIVLIEALACGTPVVAYRRGSIPEVIEHGVTGFVCDDIDSAVKAIHNIDTISRKRCRHSFETRFTCDRMADDYLRIYEKLLLRGKISEFQSMEDAMLGSSLPMNPVVNLP